MHTLADGLSVLRIVLSLLAAAFVPNGKVFLILYAAAGLTDVADGPIARKTHTESPRGALLDTLADIPLFAAEFLYLYVVHAPLVSRYLPCIVAIVGIRALSVIVIAVRFRTFALLHTYLNKAAGILLFLLPYLALWSKTAGWLFPIRLVIATAAASACEELFIAFSDKTLHRDRRGLWDRT